MAILLKRSTWMLIKIIIIKLFLPTNLISIFLFLFRFLIMENMCSYPHLSLLRFSDTIRNINAFLLIFFCLLGQLMQLKLGRWSITFVMLIKAMLLLKLCRFYVESSNIKTKRQRCVGITDECTILDKTEFFFLKLFNFN